MDQPARESVAKAAAFANGLRKNVTAAGRRWAQWPGGAKNLAAVIASIDDIEETATSLWLHEQLNCIRELLVEHGADDEMLDAVDYLVDDNKGWINPEIAEALGSTGTGEA